MAIFQFFRPKTSTSESWVFFCPDPERSGLCEYYLHKNTTGNPSYGEFPKRKPEMRIDVCIANNRVDFMKIKGLNAAGGGQCKRFVSYSAQFLEEHDDACDRANCALHW
jgi:hypothetical protein